MGGRARMLVVAIGNPMRWDDGIALRVAQLLAGNPSVELVVSSGYTPELADAVARHSRVVIVDADALATAVRFEPAGDDSATPAPGRWLGPSHVIDLARRAFGFAGEAWLCRVPARDPRGGGGVWETAAREAARSITELTLQPQGEGEQEPDTANPVADRRGLGPTPMQQTATFGAAHNDH